ncbi:MAG TPA: hypothetical protein PLB01_00125 [Thermoanaerobaculia bacterium]|nr:hypothetical protein [Thermoanaerobaculia bacterium]
MLQHEPIEVPDAGPMKQEGLAIVEQALAVHITDPESHKAAAEQLVHIAGMVKRVKAAFAEPKRLAHAAHKSITALEGEALEHLEKADRLYRSAISRWLVEEDRRRAAEQARIEAEERAKAQDAAIAEAVALEAAGDIKGAERVLAEPVLAPVVEIPKTVTPGVSQGRKSYDFRITDPAAIKRQYLIPDEVAIRKIVKAMGPDAATVIGGIEVLEERIVSVRGN